MGSAFDVLLGILEGYLENRKTLLSRKNGILFSWNQLEFYSRPGIINEDNHRSSRWKDGALCWLCLLACLLVRGVSEQCGQIHFQLWVGMWEKVLSGRCKM